MNTKVTVEEKSASTTDLQRVREQCSEYLSRIERLFKPGARLTLIVRRPGDAEQDFMLSSDDLHEAIAVLERSKMRSPT